MDEKYNLVWADQPGKNERELELWSGTRKICGFKDIRDERMLEEAVELANTGAPAVARADAFDDEEDE